MRRKASPGPARLLVLLLFLPLTASCGAPREVPTERVERRLFEHRVTAEGTLVAGRTTQLSVSPQVRAKVRLAWLLPDGVTVEEGQVVARFDPRPMEQKLEEGRLDLESAERRIDRTEVSKGREIRGLEADARVAGMELEHAREYQRTDSEVFSRRELLEDAIDEELAAKRRQHAEANAATQESLRRTEVELLAISRRQANDEIGEATAGLEALEVRAPHDGLFTWARNWRGEPVEVGMEMFPGRAVGELPDLESLEVEAWVLEADAGGVAEGQAAEVRVEAHPQTPFAATVKRVEPVAKTQRRGSPVQYFGVVLELGEISEEMRSRLKPGQRVRATIFLERVEDALVVPRQAIFEDDSVQQESDQEGSGQRDGTSRIWVLRGDHFEATTVEVGATGLGSAVVESGLDEGDVVALRPPPGEES